MLLSNHSLRFSKLKLYFALSRTPHGLLDMSTPAFGALLWLGRFPPLHVIVVGLLTAFAGYTAVYALNDLVDYPVDKERIRQGEIPAAETYMDDILVRHPMAHDLLSFKAGLLWTLAWSILAIVGAYMLNPICVLIFFAGCLLEAIYCFMLKVSPLRAFISGAVKTSGGIAAVFAVDSHPSSVFVVLLFVMLFCWEIGGQNIPHDWNDIEEDRRLKAHTIPVQLGPENAGYMVLGTLGVVLLTNIVLLRFSQTPFGFFYIAMSLAVGAYLLIRPAYKLYQSRERKQVMDLFNSASYYPFALLIIVVIKIVFESV